MDSKKKKVLILCNDFPPINSIGADRPYSWYKYFQEFNLYPIVITKNWQSNGNTRYNIISKERKIEYTDFGCIIRTSKVRTPSLWFQEKFKTKISFVRRGLSFIEKLLSFYFLRFDQHKGIYKEAYGYLNKNNDVHAIITTGEPFVLFKHGYRIKKKFGVRWIADYRDPWSQDIPLQKKYLLKKWSNYQEKKLLKSVSSVITVSQFVADKIALNYSNKEINIIPNGFDPEIINNISKITQNAKRLTISYAGTIYNWHPIEIFFKSLNEFLRLHSEVELKLNFYGINNQNDIHDKLIKFPYAKKCIEFHPRIPNEQLLKTLAESNVLLLFNYYSFMGTKIYDYLGLKRKILFCFTADENALILKDKYYKIDESLNANTELQSHLIKNSKSGVIVSNADKLKEVLMQLFLEFKETKNIKCESQNVEQFSREFRVKELADLIEKNISSHL